MSSNKSKSSSASTSSTSTVNTDRRQVVDNGGIGVSSDSSSISISQTDQGAIDAGKEIALAAIAGSGEGTGLLLGVAEKLFAQQQKALDTNASLAKSLSGTAQSAYADASAQAQGNKNIVYVGLAVVGILAVQSIKGGK